MSLDCGDRAQMSERTWLGCFGGMALLVGSALLAAATLAMLVLAATVWVVPWAR